MNSHAYPAREPVRTLKLSIIEACFYYIMFGFGEAYFSAYLIWMHANSFHMALISTLPVLVGSIIQIYTTQMVEWFGSRLRFIVAMAFLQGVCYLPLILVAKLPQNIILALIIVVIYQTAFRVHVPAWNSLMSEHVRNTERGEYFGFHKRISHFFILVASLVSGAIMLHFQQDPKTVYDGFILVFLVAFAARMISVLLFRKHYERPVDFSRFVHFHFRRDIQLLWKKGTGRLMLEYALLCFAQYFAIPFFAPYMLEVLHLNYFQYGMLTAIVVAGRVLFSPAWGFISDRYGCRKVILITGFGISLLTLLWSLLDSFVALASFQLLSGFFWSGYELAWFQIVMDVTDNNNRTQVYTLQQIVGSVAMLLGSLLGGWIISFNRLHASVYLLVFFLSFLLRFVAVLFFGLMSDEVSHKPETLRYRNFVWTFFRAFRNRGALYVPDLLKTTKSKKSSDANQ